MNDFVKKVKHKKLLTFLLVSIFTLAFACPVFASTTQISNYVIDSDDKKFIEWYKKQKFDSKYSFSTIYRGSSADEKQWGVVFSDSPLRVVERKYSDKETGYNLYIPKGQKFQRAIYGGDPVKPDVRSKMSDYSFPDGNSSGFFSVRFIYSTYDVPCYTYDGESFVKTDKVFFSRPVVIAEVARDLPKVVQKQTGVILPIAVSCLALLIGSIVLLPRLKIFLH